LAAQQPDKLNKIREKLEINTLKTRIDNHQHSIAEINGIESDNIW